jgi:hypothetical protein
MTNHLSIDFESWAYPDLPKFKILTSQARKKLDGGHVKESAEKILNLLKKHDTRLTFFVLAQLYDWYPETIEKIAAAGHEIAFHSYTHEIMKSKKILVDSLEKSKRFLKRFKPKGFRAPMILIEKEYYQILKDYGFEYDSSVYGPYSSKETIKGILELPVAKWARLPIGSGYFIALFGRNISWFYQLINKKGEPVIGFVHNWQIIKPRKAIFPNSSYLLKHPYYLPYTLEIGNTFEYLLKNFSFGPMKELVGKGD